LKNLQVFLGNAHRELAEEFCQSLEMPLGRANTTRFPDGEFNFQIMENVRGSDVFIVQPTSPPVDANVMELLIMIDAFRRSSQSASQR
jgi:ribose-phosphate pyrophosphokinase